MRALTLFQQEGLSQSVLSAYEQSTLHSLLAHFNIHSFFNHVIGNQDHYAAGKKENGLQWIQQTNTAPTEIVLIGDTAHDAEVADAMGTQCILLEGGSYDRARLNACGVPVYPSLTALMDAWPT